MQTPAAKTIGRKGNWTALMLSVLLLVVSLHRAEAGVNVWTTNGPHSETINALAIDPQTPTTLYAGTSGHGVFKSADGGGNWSAVNTGLTTPYGAIWVTALPIDAMTPTALYESWTGGAVFKSTDGGESWSIVDTGLHAPVVGALAIDPKAPSTVYAGTGTAGAFKSTGGGASWSAVFTGPSNLSVGVRDLAIDPQTPNTLHARNGGDVCKRTDRDNMWGFMSEEDVLRS